MNKKKIILLSFGSMTAVAVPIAAVVSCGTSLKRDSIGDAENAFASIKESPYDFSVVDDVKGVLKTSSPEFIQEYAIKTNFDGSKGFSFDGSDISYDGTETFSGNTSKFLRDGMINGGTKQEILGKAKGLGLIKKAGKYMIHDFKNVKSFSADKEIVGIEGKVMSFDASLDGSKYVVATDKGIYSLSTASTVKNAKKVIIDGTSFTFIKDGKIFKGSAPKTIVSGAPTGVTYITKDGDKYIITTNKGFYVTSDLATPGTIHDKTPFTMIKKVFVITAKDKDGADQKKYWFTGDNGMFSVDADMAAAIDKNPNEHSTEDINFDKSQRYTSKYYLYNTVPFIQSNLINDISINKEQNIIRVMTSKGLSEIYRVPTTMDKKVRLLQKIEDANFKRGFGFSSSRNIEQLDSSNDNDGLRTSLYLLSQTRGYKSVSGTSSSNSMDKKMFKQNILNSFGAMEKLFSVHSDDATDKNGVIHKDALKGFPARSYVEINSISKDTLVSKIEDDAWVRSKKNADYFWKQSTSSDEYIGHFAAYWDLFKNFKKSADKDLQKAAIRAGKLIMSISSSLLRNNLSGRNSVFEITNWARFNPTYINFYPEVIGDRKLNSSLIIMFLQAALQVSTDGAIGTMPKEKSIKPGITSSVDSADNYGFALAKLLSDNDDAHYETSENALFKHENFYKARKHGKNNKNGTIKDLTGTQVMLGSKTVEAFDFWKQPSVTGAGYFKNITRSSNNIKHFVSSPSSLTASLYNDPNKSIAKLVTPYEIGTKVAKDKYVMTEEEYNHNHMSWHPRYADTKLSNGQSPDTMSNEYNYSDDEEYFLVYPSLIETSDGIIAKIKDHIQGATLKITGADDDANYLKNIKLVAEDAATIAGNDGIGLWNLVGKLSGQIGLNVSTAWTLKNYLQDFPLDNRGRASNAFRKDIPLNSLYKVKGDLGDPGSTPYNANAAWHHRPTLSVLPSHGIDVSWHNNSGYDRSFRVTSELHYKFSLNGASFLPDYYAYLLAIK